MQEQFHRFHTLCERIWSNGRSKSNLGRDSSAIDDFATSEHVTGGGLFGGFEGHTFSFAV